MSDLINVLVIGSGGREHSICWSLKKSKKLKKLYCAPGNGGTLSVAANVVINIANHDEVINFCNLFDIGLVVVGPEVPLVEGIVDSLCAANILVFGPDKYAAQLEGSKSFTKEICKEYNIPTAEYEKFYDAKSAKEYIQNKSMPIVIKVDGLAAGKGVLIPTTLSEACADIDEIFNGKFGEAGASIIIEEHLVGEEASYFAFVDGDNAYPLETAQDHKRAYDNDEGPNTGGMGAYSPAPVMSAELCERTYNEIILPTIRDMKDKGHPYRGVLYAGLMITKTGPKLIEYNVRFGDPECQIILPRLKSDLLEIMLICSSVNDLSDDATKANLQLEWSSQACINVVMAAKGYPGSYEKNSVIKNLDEVEKMDNVLVFHAGTAISDEGEVLAIGGRVLNITALGDDIKSAQKLAYEAVKKVKWDAGFYRTDIGAKAINRK